MTRQINEAGLDLIKQFEGCRLEAYQDSVGIWTIGYGHTKGVSEGDAITEEQATALLYTDLAEAEAAVSRLASVDLSDNQFAALVSFVFNLGASALAGSTLLSLLNDGDYDGASAQFIRWDHDGVTVSAGLLRRREAEQTLFDS